MMSRDSCHRYRPDVDGLRAIAVLAVIFFHIDRSLLPGGFVGVDVFFVISGFLITGNIVGEIESGSFSLVEFYRRRVKRIAPAMLVVVAVTMFASQLLLLPEDARTAAKSAVWSLVSMANVYFWLYQDGGYFAADTAHAPLVHLWSLGIEEQFYLLWPLFLLLCHRGAARWRSFAAAAAILVGSFVLGDILYERSPSFVYYMLPTRAGELLAGGLVAFVLRRRDGSLMSPVALSTCAAVGAFLLAASLLFLNERLPFPGRYALPPTIGAALLLLAGAGRRTFASRVLSLQPLVLIGLISYSAYLWHWPLLAFFRYGYGAPNLVSGTLILVSTLSLAWLTYWYVEQPARRSRAPVLVLVIRQLVVPAGALLVAAFVLVYPQQFGIELRTERYLRSLAEIRKEVQPAFKFGWGCQRQRVTTLDMIDPRCVLGAESAQAPQAVLWGDSNAAHYIGVVEAIAAAASFRFRNIEVGSCPPIDADPKPFVAAERLADCRASLSLLRPVIRQFPVVIISASWPSYQASDPAFMQEVFNTVRGLANDGKLVILLGKVPVMSGYDPLCREKALAYPALVCPRVVRAAGEAVTPLNDRLRSFANRTPNVRYFDATRYLCPQQRCSAYEADGTPLYYDQSHLTAEASAGLGAAIVNEEGVPAAFRFSGVTPHAQSTTSR